jgi:hypothetical protein
VHRSERRLLPRKLLIEVASIGISFLFTHGFSVSYFATELKDLSDTHDGWFIRRRNPHIQNVIPIDILEERMTLDLFCVAFPRPESPVGIAGKELFKAQCHRVVPPN